MTQSGNKNQGSGSFQQHATVHEIQNDCNPAGRNCSGPRLHSHGWQNEQKKSTCGACGRPLANALSFNPYFNKKKTSLAFRGNKLRASLPIETHVGRPQSLLVTTGLSPPSFSLSPGSCNRVENESRQKKKAPAGTKAVKDEDPYGGSTDENTDAEDEQDHPVPELPGEAALISASAVSRRPEQMSCAAYQPLREKSH